MLRRSLPALILVLPLAAQVPAPAPVAHPVVKIITNYGAMTVELDPQAAPQTVANFLRYVKEGHFKGTVFQRVIDGFMIQGGGVDAALQQKPTHASIPNEAPKAMATGLKNTRGTIAMARTSEPDSATDQFFINLVDNENLDSRGTDATSIGYCPFGRVIAGMAVADAIAKVRTGFQKGMANVPDFPVRIKDVELVKPPSQ